MITGTVKWFNAKKGYGFIAREAGEDLFVHLRSLDDKEAGLAEGDVVEFDVVSGPKGESASHVKIVKKQERVETKAEHSQSLDKKLQTLRKTSKEKQTDLSNRLKRR